MHNHRSFFPEALARHVVRAPQPVGAAASSLPARIVPRAAAAVALGAVFLALGSCMAPGSGTASCHTVNDCTAAAAPICDAESLTCRACSPTQPSDDTACRNGHPGTPRCGPGGTCVPCLVNTDCPDKVLKPACRNYACGPCQQATDCPSFICSTDGSCAQVAEVAFVNNKNGSCQGTGHQGTLDDPHCSIQDAVDATVSGGKALISVAASTRSYDPVAIRSASIASKIYISGASSELGAVVIQGNNGEPAIYVASPPGKTISVNLRNLDLVGVSPTTRNVVECEAKGELSLTSSRVHDSGLNGIVSNDCQLTIDAVRIYNNAKTGLLVTGATYPYSISNVIVWRNNATGIAFGGSSTGTLRFATVVNNGIPGNDKPAGIDCGAGQNAVDYSIVFDNFARPPGGTSYTDLQLSGCKLNQVVTNDTHAIEGTMVTRIDFINASGSSADQMDLRLKADSTPNHDCCIDKVTATGLISHDVDLQKRPSPTGGAADIGAFEVQQ